MIWSIIQLGIVLVFAGIYMRFPCYDFVVPDEDTSCTGGYQEPTSTLCRRPLPLHSLPRGAIPSRPSRKFETALWYSIVTMTTVGWLRPPPCARARLRLSARRARLSYGDFYAKSSGARWIAASQMWFAAMMANDIIAEGDDSKLIRKFICDDGLLKSLDTEGVENICAWTEARGVPTLRQNTTSGGQDPCGATVSLTKPWRGVPPYPKLCALRRRHTDRDCARTSEDSHDRGAGRAGEARPDVAEALPHTRRPQSLLSTLNPAPRQCKGRRLRRGELAQRGLGRHQAPRAHPELAVAPRPALPPAARDQLARVRARVARPAEVEDDAAGAAPRDVAEPRARVRLRREVLDRPLAHHHVGRGAQERHVRR